MSRNPRELFKTDTQYKRWLEYESFFQKLIDLQSKGVVIFGNQGDEFSQFGKFEFRLYNHESHIIERLSTNSTIIWIGCSYDCNKKSNRYEFLHIEYPLKTLIKQYQFQYFENPVLITMD